VNPLAHVVQVLRDQDIGFALIGAMGMAVHGVSRATADLDLLVVDPEVLSPELWAPLREGMLEVELRPGDATDPLAGVVRISSSELGSEHVDIVVGKHAWQREAIARARPAQVAGVQLSVVRASDLILLKLFAGGAQDAWDIHQLLEQDVTGDLAAVVEQDLARLPAGCRHLWRRICEG
jgi:predicted nucleotidyltransferase